MGDPTPKCSKCSEPLDTSGYPKWCRRCRLEYQESYAHGKLNRAEAKGFAMGVALFRAILVEEFGRLGASGFDGEEAAALIAQAPGPARPDKADELQDSSS